MTFLVVNPLKNEWFIDSVLAKKFEQNFAKIYINPILFVYFLFSSNQFKLKQKALKNYLYKRILKTAKLSQNKKLRSSNLTGVETQKVRLFRSTSTERKRN